jgi:outer membrane receptor for ferrienterochelin and colicins
LPVKALTFSANGTYTGRMYLQHFGVDVADDVEFRSPTFFDLSLKMAYSFNITASTKLQLDAGVQNIFNSYQSDFDKGETRDAGYIYGPAMPRSFFAGLKFNL